MNLLTPMETTLFQGEDSRITLDLGTYTFTELLDVIVGIKIDSTLVKTCKKTETGAEQIIVDADPNKCNVLIFRTETQLWEAPDPPKVARLILEVTLVIDDDDFPDGKHETETIYLANFSPLATATA